MPQQRDAKILPYSPVQMFDLVADVARYPEFLPWNSAARIRSRRPIEGGEEMEADLVISFKVFREKFGSRVTLLPGQARILTEYIDGPFKHLQAAWDFRHHPEGCDVHFEVDFEFRNAILASVIGLVFSEAMSRIIRAFEARAHQIYGAN